MAKRYIENNLNPKEYVVLEAKISWLTLVLPLIWLALNLALDLVVFSKIEKKVKMDENVLMLIEVIFTTIEFGPLLGRILRNKSTCLAVTNRRVIGKAGVFRIKTIDFPIERVGSVAYDAGFWGNLLRYYKIEVRSSGVSTKTPVFPGFSNAAAFKNAVSDARELHADDGRKEQAKMMAEAIVEAMRMSTLQFMSKAPERPAPTPEDVYGGELLDDDDEDEY